MKWESVEKVRTVKENDFKCCGRAGRGVNQGVRNRVRAGWSGLRRVSEVMNDGRITLISFHGFVHVRRLRL